MPHSPSGPNPSSTGGAGVGRPSYLVTLADVALFGRNIFLFGGMLSLLGVDSHCLREVNGFVIHLKVNLRLGAALFLDIMEAGRLAGLLGKVFLA